MAPGGGRARRVVLTVYRACAHARWLFLCSLACLALALITSFAPRPFGKLRPSDEVASGDPAAGCRGISYCVCPRPTICADSLPRMVFLGLARGSAYLDYPLYMLLFLGKAKNLQSYLQTTVFALYVDISDHRLHTIAGSVVGFEVFWHSFWHLLRWGTRGEDIRFLWETGTGRTGLLSLCLTPLIVWPAMLPSLKRKMSYEFRKGLHYLAVVWGASICFHAPATQILKLIGIPVVIYVADYFYGLVAKTHLIRSTHFRRLETCSAMSFVNPPGFKLDGPGYVYLCLPWINPYQWHAFSAFPHTDGANKTSLWIVAVGEWTTKLHNTISKPTSRPAWVAGPFESPYGRAIAKDKILAVASGIGITPALALLREYATTRSVNLVWMCRDASLVEFFLENARFGADAWTLIYYTGKRPLRIGELPANVIVFKARPKLEQVVRSVVYDIEDSVGLEEGNDVIKATPSERRGRIAIKAVMATYSREEIFQSAASHAKWRINQMDQKPVEWQSRASYASLDSTITDAAGALKKASANGLCRAIIEMCEEGAPPEAYVLGLIGGESDTVMLYADFERAMDHIEGELDDSRMPTHRSLEGDTVPDDFDYSRGAQLSPRDCGCLPHKPERRPPSKAPAAPPRTLTAYPLSDKFRKEICANWQVLYCGGAQPIVDELATITSKFGLPFSIEKFDW